MSVCHLQSAPGQATEQGLHALFKACVNPLDILVNMQHLVEGSSDGSALVNEVDHKGDTPLALLVLHINRGLRYHPYKIADIQDLEDNYAPQHVIDATCQRVDENYQSQVSQCIDLLLSYGAGPNHIGGTCPMVVAEPDWAEGFETKIMQSERRWNLLGLGASMKYSKYNTFDPLTNCKVLNTGKLAPLHLAAWRGDAHCLEQLIQGGADVTARAADGRSVLHFLYHYCNRPNALPEATRLLIQAGADVNVTDSGGNTPLMLLLYHVFMKRSHVRYMATQLLTEEYRPQDASADNFHKEILETLSLLIEAGASVNHINKDADTPLHVLYRRFRRALENCDDDFQAKGHHIVPYVFQVKPLIMFSEFLLGHGAMISAVDVYGNTVLHKLSQCIKGLSLSEELNPASDLLACFNVLLRHGVNVNAQGSLMKTAVHMLLETVVHRGMSTQPRFDRYRPVLEMMMEFGCDVNKPDQLGNTAISMLFGNTMSPKDNLPVLLFLLQCGGDPSIHNRDGKFPLQLLLRLHVLHHDPSHHGQVTSDLTHFLNVMNILCQTMTLTSLNDVVSVYQEAGFYGVICEAACPVYQRLVSAVCQPRSLAHMCRLVVWRHMRTSFYIQHAQLPLPRDIRTYLIDLVS